MASAPSPPSGSSPTPPDRPWTSFAQALAGAAALHDERRPLKLRVRWEVYDYSKQRFVYLPGSTFTYAVRQRVETLAERLWRAVEVVLG